MTPNKTEAPEPARVRCRWCEQPRRSHHDTFYCAHCDEVHDTARCEMCTQVRGRTDSREFK